MRSTKLLPIFAAAASLGCLTTAMSASTTVLNNLTEPATATPGFAYWGAAFVDGPSASTLASATLLLHYIPLTPTLEVETRNANGSVGSTLYASFLGLYNPATDSVTFAALSDFTLAANESYWLVYSDPLGTSLGNAPRWDFTNSTSYSSSLGFSLPNAATTFLSSADNSSNEELLGLSSGPQMFSLAVNPPSAVPEPATLWLSLLIAPLAAWGRKRTLGR